MEDAAGGNCINGEKHVFRVTMMAILVSLVEGEAGAKGRVAEGGF